MTTVYWIRHGEAEGNLYRRCHGQYDSLITPNGRAQIEALRARFESFRLDAVYASDLFRARYTANSLASVRGQTVNLHPGLRELYMGVWEDRTWIEVGRRWGRTYTGLTDRPWVFSAPGGEHMLAARDRALSALYDILARHAQAQGDQAVAIVSHGLVTRAVMARIQNMPDHHMAAIPHGDNTSVCKLTFDGRQFQLEYYADNSHLGGLSTLARQSWWRGSGGIDRGFWFRAVKFPSEAKYVEAYRQDAWELIYGDLSNFSGPAFVEEARRLSVRQPELVLLAMSENRRAGMLQMEYDSTIMPGAGHIAFLYLTPEHRGHGLGGQLLGQAVSVCRAWGCPAIALRVYEGNARALRFYQKYGFTAFGEEDSFSGRLILMSLDIRVPPP